MFSHAVSELEKIKADLEAKIKHIEAVIEHLVGLGEKSAVESPEAKPPGGTDQTEQK